MPRLPDATALGQRSPLHARQGFARADTESAGLALAQLGATVTRVGDEFARGERERAEKLEREQATDEVFRARRALNDWELARIHDPEKGAAATMGQGAFGVGKTLLTDFDKESAKIGEGLKTQRGQQAFQELVTSRRNQVGEWAAGHEARARRVVEKADFESDLVSMQERAVRTATTPADTPEAAARRDATAKAEISLGQQRIVEFLKRQGMPEAVITDAVKDFGTKAHAGVVESLLASSDTAGAQAYLKANEGSMGDKEVARLKGRMQQAVSLGKAQVGATEVIDKGLTGQAAIDAVREKFKDDPITQERAVHEVKTRLAEREVAKRDVVEQLTADAWRPFLDGGTVASSLNSTAMAKLREAEPEKAVAVERQIRSDGETRWRRAKADREDRKHVETPETLTTYLTMREQARTDPVAFLEATTPDKMVRLQPLLTKQHFATLEAVRDGINKKDAIKQSFDKVLSATLRNPSVREAIDGAGVKLSGKMTKAEQERATLFMGRVQDAFDQWPAGERIDEKQARALVMNLLREEVEQGSERTLGGLLWDTKPRTKRAFDPGKEGAVYVRKTFGDIPQMHRDALIEHLNQTRVREGKPPLRRGVGRAGQPGVYMLGDEERRAVEIGYSRLVQMGEIKE